MLLYELLFSITFIEWTLDNKNPNVKHGKFVVPLRYNEYSPINLTLPIVYANFNATKSPILFFGPGNGYGNIPEDFNFVQTSFPDNPMIFLGYRGVESDPSPIDKHFKSLTRVEIKNIDDRLLQKIMNKTFQSEQFLLNDFWITQRAQDALKFLDEEKPLMEFFHIIAIGEDGSRIAHQIAANLSNRKTLNGIDESKRLIRIVMAGASVLSWPIPHSDTTTKLLAVIKSRCKRDPSCPYKNVHWIPPPENIPKHAYWVFNVHNERIEYSVANQLRVPSMIPSALDILQSITDGSPLGYVAVSGFSGPESSSVKWTDAVLHACATPFDKSLVPLPSITKICPYIKPIHYFGYSEDVTVNSTYPDYMKMTQPMLIITGEFDLPRSKTVLNYYRNVSYIPSLIDHISLNLTSSRFELLRDDVLKAVINYLNDGNTTFEIAKAVLPFKQWKTQFRMTTLLKWMLGSGFAITIIASIYVWKKSEKEERSGKRRNNPEKEEALNKWTQLQRQQKPKAQ